MELMSFSQLLQLTVQRDMLRRYHLSAVRREACEKIRSKNHHSNEMLALHDNDDSEKIEPLEIFHTVCEQYFSKLDMSFEPMRCTPPAPDPLGVVSPQLYNFSISDDETELTLYIGWYHNGEIRSNNCKEILDDISHGVRVINRACVHCLEPVIAIGEMNELRRRTKRHHRNHFLNYFCETDGGANLKTIISTMNKVERIQVVVLTNCICDSSDPILELFYRNVDGGQKWRAKVAGKIVDTVFIDLQSLYSCWQNEQSDNDINQYDDAGLLSPQWLADVSDAKNRWNEHGVSASEAKTVLSNYHHAYPIANEMAIYIKGNWTARQVMMLSSECRSLLSHIWDVHNYPNQPYPLSRYVSLKKHSLRW